MILLLDLIFFFSRSSDTKRFERIVAFIVLFYGKKTTIYSTSENDTSALKTALKNALIAYAAYGISEGTVNEGNNAIRNIRISLRRGNNTRNSRCLIANEHYKRINDLNNASQQLRIYDVNNVDVACEHNNRINNLINAYVASEHNNRKHDFNNADVACEHNNRKNDFKDADVACDFNNRINDFNKEDVLYIYNKMTKDFSNTDFACKHNNRANDFKNADVAHEDNKTTKVLNNAGGACKHTSWANDLNNTNVGSKHNSLTNDINKEGVAHEHNKMIKDSKIADVAGKNDNRANNVNNADFSFGHNDKIDDFNSAYVVCKLNNRINDPNNPELAWIQKNDFKSLIERLSNICNRFGKVLAKFRIEFIFKEQKESKYRTGKFKLVVVSSEVFEEAMIHSRVDSVVLSYVNEFPSDIRMFICIPVYMSGKFHSKP